MNISSYPTGEVPVVTRGEVFESPDRSVAVYRNPKKLLCADNSAVKLD